MLQIPLPEGVGARMESAPIIFGDDWPGMFIRGDHALHLATCLRQAAAILKKHDHVLDALNLIAYADLLAECTVRPTP